jgi:hypothetical protein
MLMNEEESEYVLCQHCVRSPIGLNCEAYRMVSSLRSAHSEHMRWKGQASSSVKHRCSSLVIQGAAFRQKHTRFKNPISPRGCHDELTSGLKRSICNIVSPVWA